MTCPLDGEAYSIADSMLATEVSDLEAGIALLQDGDNLCFVKSARFHENLLGEFCQKALLSVSPYFNEAHTFNFAILAFVLPVRRACQMQNLS